LGLALVGAAGVLLGVGAAPEARACTVWQTADGLDLHFPAGTTIRYYIQQAGTEDVEGEGEFEAIQRAFEQWSAVICGEGPALTFEYVGTADTDAINFDPRFFRDEKNMVAFVNEGWDDPAVVARARILWDNETGEIMEFGIGLNDQHADWSTADGGASGSFDIQDVLVRQIGLTLGLGDSEVEAAAMFPGNQTASVRRRTLDADDEAAICDLYAPGRDYTAVPEGAACGRDLHPGVRPDQNNSTANNSTANNGAENNGAENNGENNGAENNAAENNSEPEPPTDLGPGANCTGSEQCAEGLICGCPESLGECAQNICYALEEEAPAEEKEDEGCAAAPGRASGWGLGLGLLALLWGLRRRRG
jgi:MYXO-CTERM domain-containing protein